MNTKLRELAKQATNWCIENAEGTPVAWEWEDKLAELIVKECVNVLRQEWYNENNKVIDDKNLREVNVNYGHKKGLIQAINNMSEHFGVEE